MDEETLRAIDTISLDNARDAFISSLGHGVAEPITTRTRTGNAMRISDWRPVYYNHLEGQAKAKKAPPKKYSTKVTKATHGYTVTEYQDNSLVNEQQVPTKTAARKAVARILARRQDKPSHLTMEIITPNYQAHLGREWRDRKKKSIARIPERVCEEDFKI